ncbi:thioesterase domain-containing protein [Bacillus gobiensis]|uniref:thioesterase II family protein n=1 Tax=Bacillus gobiensis TaxID=1441095 RepID=UPI003D21D0A9
MQNKWVIIDEVKPEARMRLFCFSYAGGGANVYKTWNKYLPDDLELASIELPGRGRRITEPSIRHKDILVETLKKAILPYLEEKPFCFFGHSMGALIAYELIQSLNKSEGLLPRHFFPSAHRAPHLQRSTNKTTYNLPDDALIQRLRELDGTPETVLNNKELLNIVLPIMRADLQICETYQYSADNKVLSVPITAFAGKGDRSVAVESIDAWSSLTSRSFDCIKMEGNHFFIHQHEQVIVQKIAETLELSVV